MSNTKFRRYCKVLELESNADLMKEYKQRHSKGAVWPEIIQGLRQVGVLDMEIYLHGNTLFMIMDMVADVNHELAMKQLAGLPRQAEWEAEMSKYQKSSPEASASEKWELIDRVFNLDQSDNQRAEEGNRK